MRFWIASILAASTAIVWPGGIAMASSEEVISQERTALSESCSSLELLDGFATTVDVNGDNLPDVVTNYQRILCDGSQMMFCGSGGCTRNVFIQRPDGSFFQVGSFLTYEIEFDSPADASFLVAAHGMNCGQSGVETCQLRFQVSGDTAVLREDANEIAVEQTSQSASTEVNSTCGLLPDINAITVETMREVSARLVNIAADAAQACASMATAGGVPEISLRLAIALAAIPERAAEARELAAKLSDEGSAEARNLLGSMLSNGIGGPVNDAQAAILFHQAAQAGFGPAMFNYGMARLHGVGLPAYRQHAILWLERAVGAGDAEAMAVLGWLLLSGDGQVADRPRGLELIHAAVDANGLRSASEAKASYDYLAAFSGGHDIGLPPHAQTSEQAGENWEKFLALAAERGDRRFMIEAMSVAQRKEGAEEVLEAVIAPLKPEDRLASWLSRIAITHPDRDQDVYTHLLLYRGMLLYSIETDIQPYIDRMTERLSDSVPSKDSDGLDVRDEDIAHLWREAGSKCAAGEQIGLETYLQCARADALAELLWMRSYCPDSGANRTWLRCEQ